MHKIWKYIDIVAVSVVVVIVVGIVMSFVSPYFDVSQKTAHREIQAVVDEYMSPGAQLKLPYRSGHRAIISPTTPVMGFYAVVRVDGPFYSRARYDIQKQCDALSATYARVPRDDAAYELPYVQAGRPINASFLVFKNGKDHTEGALKVIVYDDYKSILIAA